jgi:hypothetical protein
MRLIALFRLAFATAPADGLTLPHRVTRWLIMQKARRQACPEVSKLQHSLRLLVSTRFQVLFHSPHRGTFHLSLTVLVHYRSPRVFSLRSGPPRFPQGFTCPVVLRNLERSSSYFAYGAVTLFGRPFQSPSAIPCIFNFVEATATNSNKVPQPRHTTLAGFTHVRFRLFPVRSPLLWESRLLSFPRGT